MAQLSTKQMRKYFAGLIFTIICISSTGHICSASMIDSEVGFVTEKLLERENKSILQSGKFKLMTVRLTEDEVLHTHDDFDLIVVMVGGSADLHVPSGRFTMIPNDIALIHRGSEHWAQLNSAQCTVQIIKIFN